MSEQRDRPEICRDCSRYETDCQGSNQEDCARRLDRPELTRAEVEPILTKHFNEKTGVLNFMAFSKDILALFSDEEGIRKQEMERIRDWGNQKCLDHHTSMNNIVHRACNECWVRIIQ